MTVWEAVVTGFGGGFVPLKGSERVGEMRVSDDELGFEFGMGNEPTEVEKEKRRREIEEWRISRCWEVLSALGPSAWSTPGTTGIPETGKEFASRRFTSLSLGEQRMVLLMRALVSRPPLVLLDEVWSGMDEGMINAVRRYLTEGGGVGEGQAVVAITHWEEEVPWVGEEVRRFRILEGDGSVLDE
jgi:ABC-type glutathione transport system ATPase component